MCAEVQAGIANVLIKNGSDYKALQASLRSLRYDMLDVTQLYKKHAEPLHMHDTCLRLMQIADYKDSQKVNELWQRILLQGVEPCDVSPTSMERITYFCGVYHLLLWSVLPTSVE
ncbi:hypothetical protein SARC_16581, partial [Sphaeroforma arctica JP610]